MKKTHINQISLLFRKAVWSFVFISLISFNYFPATTFISGLGEYLSLTSAESQREMSKQAGKNESVPYSNSGEEKSESDTQLKDLKATIYSKNRRLVSYKTKLVSISLSRTIIEKNPRNDTFPRYFSNLSNTCFVSLYRFSIF